MNKRDIKNKIKNKGFFKILKEGYVVYFPEITLWRAVLDRALVDYLDTKLSESESIEYWLTSPNSDFKLVCKLACLEPDFVAKYFVDIKKLLN